MDNIPNQEHREEFQQKMDKLKPRERRFVELVLKNEAEGNSKTLSDLYVEAGWKSKQNVSNKYNSPKIQRALRAGRRNFVDYLLQYAPESFVANTIGEDIKQKDDKRVRNNARQQWLKATGNAGADKVQVDSAEKLLKELSGK